MIMRQNYFLDLLAVDSPSASSSGNTSSTIFSHSGAELHRLNAHRAQAS